MGDFDQDRERLEASFSPDSEANSVINSRTPSRDRMENLLSADQEPNQEGADGDSRPAEERPSSRSPRQPNGPSGRRSQGDMDSQMDMPLDTDRLLVSGAKQIISLFIPVSTCMLLVVIIACTVKFYAGSNIFFVYTPFNTPGAGAATQVWQSVANALIFMCVIVVMTIVLVLLFKYECYKFINGWLIMTTGMVLFYMTLMCLTEILQTINIFVDYITIAIVMWSFGCMGLMTIHWKGPLFLQQLYLIVISSQMALIFLKFVPQWTVWVLLAVLAIWDLIAVLCPHGPLRMLVEMAQEREQPLLPALIYSTTAAFMVKQSTDAPPAPTPATAETGGASGGAANEGEDAGANNERGNNCDDDMEVSIRGDNSNPQNLESSVRARAAVSALNGHSPPADPRTPNDADQRRNMLRELQSDVLGREERGVKLGLGDFVFYSLLMGRAALDGDPGTILACYVSILIGMCLTILLLAIAGRALPALPISIGFGITFYFVTSLIISPFINEVVLGRVIL